MKDIQYIEEEMSSWLIDMSFQEKDATLNLGRFEAPCSGTGCIDR